MQLADKSDADELRSRGARQLLLILGQPKQLIGHERRADDVPTDRLEQVRRESLGAYTMSCQNLTPIVR